MNLSVFLAQVDFLTPKVFRKLGGCGTRPSAVARTGSDILAVRTFPRSDSLAYSSMLWLKPPFARKSEQVHFKQMDSF
jgi:hypothetical protein